MTFPSVYYHSDSSTANFCSLACDPGYMRGVGPGQPVDRDTVAQSQGIQAYLKGTQVQISMGTTVTGVAAGLSKQGCG
uniref:Uncharacterized protein n=1 Tax=Arion vulgaris TaxID=1028688 RepID=A0A0B6ZIK9_9EUPU